MNMKLTDLLKCKVQISEALDSIFEAVDMMDTYSEDWQFPEYRIDKIKESIDTIQEMIE